MKVIKSNLVKYIISILIVVSGLLLPVSMSAQSGEDTFVVYFTGIGCPHCANVDPVLLHDWVNKYSNLYVIEYEIYQKSQNAHLIEKYNQTCNSGYGIPLVIFNKENSLVGDKTILSDFDSYFNKSSGNKILFPDGTEGELEDIDSLPIYSKIWTKDRIAIKESSGEGGDLLIDFLKGYDVNEIINNDNAKLTQAESVAFSGSEVTFDNAVNINGWVLQWNGESVKGVEIESENEDANLYIDSNSEQSKISFARTISLAAVDAVNPCALAVLTMMLIAIISYNPNDKKNIILAGLAFTVSVFIMYMIYGLIIIRFFKLIQAITSMRLILYKLLGIVALLLGLLQIKDYIKYKPGSVGTEMPLFMRPKVKKIISGITSPIGAFGIGFFVTIFLLPCTIGPYVILGGMLSFSEIVESIPHLFLYNLIFVLPMLVITGVVYLGISKVEDVSEWKDKNIRILHLIAGLIMAVLGIFMFAGWV